MKDRKVGAGKKLAHFFDYMRKIFLRSSAYRKITKISPGTYIFQRPFLRDLFFGGAYIRRKVCVSKVGSG